MWILNFCHIVHSPYWRFLQSKNESPVALSHQNLLKYLFRTIFDSCFAYKRCIICAYSSPDSDKIIGESNVIDKDTYFSSILLQKRSIDGLELCQLIMDYCAVFVSCLDLDGTHSLQRIHWWASDVMLHFSKSVLMNRQTQTSWIAWGVSTFSTNFHFSFL